MSKKNDATPLAQKREVKPEKMYPTDKLLMSRQLSGYQQDFARAVLKEPAYTIAGAKAALDKAWKGEG